MSKEPYRQPPASEDGLQARRPFLFPGRKESGVVLVHGFTGSPYDVRELGAALADRGYQVAGLRLPGHGTTPADLNRVTAFDWLQAVVDAEKELRATCSRIHYVGLSLGGCLGLELIRAGRIQPASLTLISTPVFQPKAFLHRWVIPLIWRWKPFGKKYWLRPEDRQWYDRVGKYTVIPLHASLEMYRLIERLRPDLRSVTTPTLIVQSESDPVVEGKSARYLEAQLGSSEKNLYWAKDTVHQILNGPKRFDTIHAICEFIDHHD